MALFVLVEVQSQTEINAPRPLTIFSRYKLAERILQRKILVKTGLVGKLVELRKERCYTEIYIMIENCTAIRIHQCVTKNIFDAHIILRCVKRKTDTKRGKVQWKKMFL